MFDTGNVDGVPIVTTTAPTLKDWLVGFCDLHNKARVGQLDAAAKPAYLDARDQLATALLAAQRLTLKPGERPRQALRVLRAMKVELEFPSGPVSGLTQDFSSGGLSVMVPHAQPDATRARFSFKLSRAAEPVTGWAVVISSHTEHGSSRVSLRYAEIETNVREAIESAVFDEVVRQLGGKILD